MKSVAPIRVGVSSCLLGQRVRYDGDHKLDRFIVGTLGKYFEFVPVCPEVAIGRGTPRPPMRLVGNPASPHAVDIENPALDVTQKLVAYGRQQARALDDISGYIFKSRSPSCGMGGVQVYAGHGRVKRGHGIYAATLMNAWPLLPVEEEGRLGDPDRRDNFLERVFAYRRWQALEAAGITATRLAAFHAAHRLSLLAHGEVHVRALDRLVARATRGRVRRVADAYRLRFVAALASHATRRRHAGVLRYVVDCLESKLGTVDRAELREVIGDYRVRRLPLAAPVMLLRHHLRRTGMCECRDRHVFRDGGGRAAPGAAAEDVESGRRDPDLWLMCQVYLYPDPREFVLRYGS